jgi:hypothetical protein
MDPEVIVHGKEPFLATPCPIISFVSFCGKAIAGADKP